MAPIFERDEDLCKRYAQFAAELDRWHFKVIYWFMFFLNLIILFLASWTYTRGQEALERYSHEPQKRTRSLRKNILICVGCVIASTFVVTMEAYALLALQFCDGENLMSLYWATWTMIQIGSLIAMIGIILAFAHSLRNRRHPPWALALGTPVLVIAGILHLLHDCAKKRVKRMRNSVEINLPNDDHSMSEANTIPETPGNMDNLIQGEFIGLTVEGGPIVRFNNTTPKDLDMSGELLGYFDGNRRIVAYHRDEIRFISVSPKEEPPADSKAPEKEKSPEMA